MITEEMLGEEETKSDDHLLPVKKEIDEQERIPLENMNLRKPVTLWVSNIPRKVRASDLKTYFSQSGNVLSAKILTNGKCFYGCVTLESSDQANKCLKDLNNSDFEGNVIHIAKHRPDMKRIVLENKSPKLKVNVEKHMEKTKSSDQHVVERETENEEKQLKDRERINEKNEKIITDLEKRLKNANVDLLRMRRKLEEFEKKKTIFERKSSKDLERIRAERRRLNQDKENFEKMKREYQKEITNEKASVLKELDEARALRIKLQNRLDNFLTSTPRPKRKSRSPLSRNTRNNIEHGAMDRRHKDRDYEWKTSKRYRNDDSVTAKVLPPSPPRLTEFDRRGPQRNEYFQGHRPYYSDNISDKVSNIRQKPNFDSFSRENRNSYPMSYVKDAPKYQVHMSSLSTDRFGNPMQSGPQMLGPSRNGHNQYVPEFAKPFGHY